MAIRCNLAKTPVGEYEIFSGSGKQQVLNVRAWLEPGGATFSNITNHPTNGKATIKYCGNQHTFTGIRVENNDPYIRCSDVLNALDLVIIREWAEITLRQAGYTTCSYWDSANSIGEIFIIPDESNFNNYIKIEYRPAYRAPGASSNLYNGSSTVTVNGSAFSIPSGNRPINGTENLHPVHFRIVGPRALFSTIQNTLPAPVPPTGGGDPGDPGYPNYPGDPGYPNYPGDPGYPGGGGGGTIPPRDIVIRISTTLNNHGSNCNTGTPIKLVDDPNNSAKTSYTVDTGDHIESDSRIISSIGLTGTYQSHTCPIDISVTFSEGGKDHVFEYACIDGIRANGRSHTVTGVTDFVHITGVYRKKEVLPPPPPSGDPCPNMNKGEFRVSNFGSGTGIGNLFWRGYVFKLNTDTRVVSLIGGGTTPGFQGAIFRCQMQGNGHPNLLELIAWTIFDTGPECVSPITPVVLEANQTYVLAQARSSTGGDGVHYSVDNLNIAGLIDATPRIEEWIGDPSRPGEPWRWNEDGIPATELIARQKPTLPGGSRLRIGFEFCSAHDLPNVETTHADPDHLNKTAVLNGLLINSGINPQHQGQTNLFIEFGDKSNLEGSDLIIANPTSTRDSNIAFSINVSNLTRGKTYYYRAVAVNEAGRIEGAIKSFEIKNTVTVKVHIEGNIGGSTVPTVGTHQFVYGTEVSFSASPNTGYLFDKWVVHSNSEEIPEPQFAWTADKNEEFTAYFAEKDYIVWIQTHVPAGTGVTDLFGKYEVGPGESFSFKAIPNPGYKYSHTQIMDDTETFWFNHDHPAFVTPDITFVPDRDVTILRCIFAPIEYILTTSTIGQGAIQIDPYQDYYYYNEEVTLTIGEESGWTFSHWEGDIGDNNPLSDIITIKMNSDKSVTAVFDEDGKYRLKINIEGDGTTLPAKGTYWYFPDESVILEAFPGNGQAFLCWLKHSSYISINDSTIEHIVAGHDEYTAFFDKQLYLVDAEPNNEEYGSAFGSGHYPHGEEVTVEAVPAKHYEFEKWTEDEFEVSIEAKYSFTVDADRILVANFKKINYLISLRANPIEGAVLTGAGLYESGSQATIVAHPTTQQGYTFVNWTENGEEVSRDLEYSFEVNSSRQLIANFEKGKYSIEVQAKTVTLED